MQAFVRRHGQNTGRVKQMANRYIGARQEGTQVNGRGLRSANYIQRARQRDDPGNRQKIMNRIVTVCFINDVFIEFGLLKTLF